MRLNNLEPKTLSEYVLISFQLLSREEKLSLFPKLCSEMIRVNLKANNFDDFAFPDDKTVDNYIEKVNCPNDACHEIVKNGVDRNGRQRFKCKTCNTTFFATQHTLSSNVTQDISVWYRFVSGMLQQESIESLAKNCSISPSTALNWQLRVFEAIRVLQEDIKLSGVIVADDTRVDYNLKGNHSDDFIMPHKSRNRGHQNTINNYQKNSICVLCAIDSENKSFSRVIGFGSPSSKRLIKGFENKISEDAEILVTDGAKAFSKVVDFYNIPQWERKTTIKKGSKKVPDVSTEFHIQKINAYHQKLKKFLRKYNGVSSRKLPGYLLMFDFLENNKGEDMDFLCSKILSVMALPNEEISYRELNAKYILPISNGPEKEIWELKIPKKEQKVYIDWYNKVPIGEITAKHHVNRRKIYTIKEKVVRFGVHDKIIVVEQSPQPKKKKVYQIYEKAWNIYKDYVLTDVSIKSLAIKYNVTTQRIGQAIAYVSQRPEASSLPKRKAEKTKMKTLQIDYSKRNEDIYCMFKFLNSKGVYLKDIYKQIAKQFSLSEGSVENLLIDARGKDAFADFRYRWSAERKKLSKDEFDLFLAKRNNQIYEDFLNSSEKDIYGKRMLVIANLANKYSLSLSQCCLIIRTQRKLRQQEQNPVQELTDAG